MTALRRIAIFARLMLTEYIRSGRILIELTLAVAFWGLFFQNPRGEIALDQVFQLSAIFSLLLTLYTSSSMLNLADRPQSYMVLTRPLARSGYLLGIYVASVLLVWGAFFIVLLLTLLVNRPLDLTVRDAVLGSIPTMLNIALLAALMLLISSQVLKNTPRLLLLAALAIALYSNSWSQARANPIISALQSIFSLLLVPSMKGYQLAQNRVLTAGDFAILLAQVAMTALILSLATLAFSRRDLILSGR
jgi:hypothetical protein